MMEISGCVVGNIWVCGGQYLNVWVTIYGFLVAISGGVVVKSGCVGGNIFVYGWQYLGVLVAISGCVVGNIWVCWLQYLGMW